MQDTPIELNCSPGLHVKMDSRTKDSEVDISAGDSGFSSHLCVRLPDMKPFEEIHLKLLTSTELTPIKENIDHRITAHGEILENSRFDIELPFIAPFTVVNRLHTAHLRKFIQITVNGLVSMDVEIFDPQLATKLSADPSQTIRTTFMNPCQQTLTVNSDANAIYMWEMDFGNETDIIKSHLSFSYRLHGELRVNRFSVSFDIKDYRTVYVVRARIEPAKCHEFCRAGMMCQLHVSVEWLEKTASPPVMYEVIADQNIWAVCGRSSGVLNFEGNNSEVIVLDVMPLLGGSLPMPSIRLAKYIPAGTNRVSGSSTPMLEPFSPGQVYNFGKAQHVQIFPAHSHTDH